MRPRVGRKSLPHVTGRSRLDELRRELVEALCSDGVEEGVAVGEVALRCSVADTRTSGEFPQGDRPLALLEQKPAPLLQQRLT